MGVRVFSSGAQRFGWSTNYMVFSVINVLASFAVALVLHELGHFIAAGLCRIRVIEAGLGWGPKVFGARILGVQYDFRLLPFGAYVRMDMAVLQRRPLVQQLFVLLAGIAVNLILAAAAWGSFFGTLNLVLAVTNLFPLYQHDGWKSGMVIVRRVFNRRSPLVEWSFTLSSGLIGLVLAARFILTF
jgi:membrane-associated protease RseP (regulator of RpoE activity)